MLCSILAVLVLFSSAIPVNISAQTANRVAYSDSEPVLDIKERLKRERVEKRLTDFENYVVPLILFPLTTTVVYALWETGKLIFFLSITFISGVLHHVFDINILGFSSSHSNPRDDPAYIN